MTVTAHAGHWLTSLIYLVPVLGVLGMIGWRHLRDRGRQDDDDPFDEPSLDDILDGRA
jgi:hypothetical protein